MSHFVGLVICTPNYADNHSIDDALEKYNENRRVPEYSRGEVSDFHKIRFVMCCKYDKSFERKLVESFYYYAVLKGIVEPFVDGDNDDIYRYQFGCMFKNQEEFAKYVLLICPDFLDDFDEVYKENGNEWNGNSWRINPNSGLWEEYSTYNPDSKWDWWADGGRWAYSIKTKYGEFVNECLLGEIDWTDFKDGDYYKKPVKNWKGETYRKLKKNVRWHFTKTEMPFCFVVDGEWIEKGQMGYWAMTSNEMSNEEWSDKMITILEKLPEDSECYLVDFHI